MFLFSRGDPDPHRRGGPETETTLLQRAASPHTSSHIPRDQRRRNKTSELCKSFSSCFLPSRSTRSQTQPYSKPTMHARNTTLLQQHPHPPPPCPSPREESRNTLPYLPHQDEPHARASQPKQQLYTCFPKQVPSRSCPTSLQQPGTGTTHSAGEESPAPPAPHLFPQGLANRPQLQAPVMASAGRFAGGEQPGPPALLSHWPLVKDPSSGFELMHQRISCYWPPRHCLLAHI